MLNIPTKRQYVFEPYQEEIRFVFNSMRRSKSLTLRKKEEKNRNREISELEKRDEKRITSARKKKLKIKRKNRKVKKYNKITK